MWVSLPGQTTRGPYTEGKHSDSENVKRPLQNDMSMSIELDDEDLLDIDGSDDPTQAFANRALLGKLRAPARKNRRADVALAAPAAAPPTHFNRPVDDPTIVMGADREDARETIPVPMKLLAAFKPSSAPPAANAPVPGSIAPKSPTISPAPPVKQRNANASYPPIAINVAPHREPAMSFISQRPSRAGWIAAAVIGVLVLVGGSLKVGAPKAPAAAGEPTPVVAPADAPAEAKGSDQEDPKVVTFGDNQGIAIRAKEPRPDAKPEPKADAKKPAPAAHPVTVKPVVKPAVPTKADTSLAASKDKDDKIPATSHEPPPSKMTPEQKKLKSIEQDLADLQLKAAAR